PVPTRIPPASGGRRPGRGAHRYERHSSARRLLLVVHGDPPVPPLPAERSKEAEVALLPYTEPEYTWIEGANPTCTDMPAMNQRLGPADRQRSRLRDRREAEQVQVLRVLAPGGRLIRKTAVGPSGRQALRREREVLHRLAGVPGVQQLAAAPAGPDVLLLREVAGTRLADLPVPMAPAPLLRLARDLAAVLAEVHARGV